MSENNGRNYNSDPEVLHSFFVKFNRIYDYHKSLCDLSTQLCILSEYFEESNSEYDHYSILYCTIYTIRELYEKLHREYQMLDDCSAIEAEILIHQ
ncbi:MAG: hypothetical protein K2L19_02710 [Eubacterium sp.]|nr:hypothetical protein [Eubacterium sp.]